MLTPMPMLSREQRIRDEFERVGPMTIPAFARHCLSIGIWAEHEIAGFALTTVEGKIRQALKAPDTSGLPYAGPTNPRDDDEAADEDESGSKAQPWRTRPLWNFDDYVLNIAEGIKQRDAIHFHIVDLADECRGRFGRAPLIVDPQRPGGRKHHAAD